MRVDGRGRTTFSRPRRNPAPLTPSYAPVVKLDITVDSDSAIVAESHAVATAEAHRVPRARPNGVGAA